MLFSGRLVNAHMGRKYGGRNWLDGIDVGVFMGPDKQDTQAVVAEQLKAANSVPAK